MAPRPVPGWPAGTPVYVNPSDGTLEASSEVDRQPIGYTILGTDTKSLSALLFGGGDFTSSLPASKEVVKMAKPKKTKKTKASERLSLQEGINNIVRRYVVTRNGSLGMEISIPASRVPEMIKEINDLVAAYIKNVEDDIKKKTINQEAQGRTLENMQKNIERALEEISKQRRKTTPDKYEEYERYEPKKWIEPGRSNPWEWDQQKLDRLKKLQEELSKNVIRDADKANIRFRSKLGE